MEAGDFSENEKKKLLFGIFKSETMRSSVNSDVLRLESFPLKVNPEQMILITELMLDSLTLRK
mgnify:CR=1 FL=1